jgi:hypothetical protein
MSFALPTSADKIYHSKRQKPKSRTKATTSVATVRFFVVSIFLAVRGRIKIEWT